MTITEQYNREIEENQDASNILVIAFAISTIAIIGIGLIAQYQYNYGSIAFTCGILGMVGVAGFLSVPIIFDWRKKGIQKGYFLLYCQKHNIDVEKGNFNHVDFIEMFVIPKLQHLEDVCKKDNVEAK